MLVSLHQLSVFRAVARHQSFTRAAEELYISQPAVSAHVRELERLYGVELFEPVGRRVRLTEAGRLLEEYADRLLALVEESRQAAHPERGEGSPLQRRPYRSDELVLVVSREHRWARAGLADLTELGEE